MKAFRVHFFPDPSQGDVRWIREDAFRSMLVLHPAVKE